MRKLFEKRYCGECGQRTKHHYIFGDFITVRPKFTKKINPGDWICLDCIFIIEKCIEKNENTERKNFDYNPKQTLGEVLCE